ncbi:hypothetical protein BJY52DRAFT_705798 [Lactarius psammicola]|nr:hypothetical protein BJY52DRAFT_705798 [Lactarius psammicola]
MTTIGRSRGISSDPFVTFTLPCIEIPILPQYDYPPPITIIVQRVPGHHPDSTLHTHDTSASEISAHAVLHDDAALVPVSLDGTFDVPSSSMPVLLCVDGNPTDAPSLHDKVLAPMSFHPAHQTTTESRHVSASPRSCDIERNRFLFQICATSRP